jgi:hypothetical protein
MLQQRLERDLDYAQNHDHILTQAHLLANVLDLTSALNINLDGVFDRTVDFSGVINSIYNLNRALDLDRAHNLDRARDLERAISLADAFGLPRDLDHILNLAHALNFSRALNFIRSLKRDSEWETVSKFIRWYIRFFTIFIATLLLEMPEKPQSYQILSQKSRRSTTTKALIKEDLKILVDWFLNLYVDYAILEERIEGKLSAFEGIRILKEPTRGSDEEYGASDVPSHRDIT